VRNGEGKRILVSFIGGKETTKKGGGPKSLKKKPHVYMNVSLEQIYGTF